MLTQLAAEPCRRGILLLISIDHKEGRRRAAGGLAITSATSRSYELIGRAVVSIRQEFCCGQIKSIGEELDN